MVIVLLHFGITDVLHVWIAEETISSSVCRNLCHHLPIPCVYPIVSTSNFHLEDPSEPCTIIVETTVCMQQTIDPGRWNGIKHEVFSNNFLIKHWTKSKKWHVTPAWNALWIMSCYHSNPVSFPLYHLISESTKPIQIILHYCTNHNVDAETSENACLNHHLKHKLSNIHWRKSFNGNHFALSWKPCILPFHIYIGHLFDFSTSL